MRLPPWLSGAPDPPWLSRDPAKPWIWTLVTDRVGLSRAMMTIDLTDMVADAAPGLRDRDREHLMGTAAWAIWALGEEGLHNRPWAPTTLINRYHYLRQATAWMASNGHARWAALTAEDVGRMKRHLYHIDRSGPPSGPDSRSLALGVLNAMRVLHARGSVPDGLTVDPRPGDAECVRKVLAAHRSTDPDYVDKTWNGTKSIPLPLAHALLETAIGLVESPLAPTVVRMADELRAASFSSDGAGRFPPGRITLEQMKVFRRWRRDAETAAVLARFGVRRPKALKDLLKDVVTACWLLVHLFAALRIEEAASIRADQAVQSRNDGWWLLSTVRKTSAEIAGSHIPVPVPELCAKAADLAERATRGYRDSRKELFLFESKNGVSTLSSGYAARRMRRFVGWRCDAPEWNGYPLASHQLRKLFVALLVRRFEGGLEVAQQHLRHVSAHMTERYTEDPELLGMIVGEQEQLVSETLHEVMSGAEAGIGPVADGARAYAAGFSGKALTVEQASAFVRRHQVRLEPAPLGWCAGDRAGAAVAACGVGRDGLPDRDNARVGKCMACANNLLLARHLPFLNVVYVIHRQMADNPDAAEPLRTASGRQCLLLAQKIRALTGEAGDEA